MTELHANIANPAPCTYTSSAWTMRLLSTERRPCQESQLLKRKIPQDLKTRNVGCTHTNQLRSSMRKDRAPDTELVLPYHSFCNSRVSKCPYAEPERTENWVSISLPANNHKPHTVRHIPFWEVQIQTHLKVWG